MNRDINRASTLARLVEDSFAELEVFMPEDETYIAKINEVKTSLVAAFISFGTRHLRKTEEL